jgi:hypothetical protein
MNEKEMRSELKHLIRELKGEIRENGVEQREAVRNRGYSQAMHLESVNGALEYVIIRMKNLQ